MQLLTQLQKTMSTTLKVVFPYNFVLYEKTKPLILGRWHNNQSDTKKSIKSDYSNLDHCGPCGLEELQEIQAKSKDA